jgi:hypothetical protein
MTTTTNKVVNPHALCIYKAAISIIDNNNSMFTITNEDYMFEDILFLCWLLHILQLDLPQEVQAL